MLQHGLQKCMRTMCPGHLGTTNSTGRYRSSQASDGLLELGELRHRCT